MMGTLKSAKEVICNPSNKIAFIIGNGINRFAYQNSNTNPSWDKLLLDAWKRASFHTVSKIDEGITYTEFYDLIEFESKNPKEITQSIIENIMNWGITDYHKALQTALIRLDKPVLTTNFDMYLEEGSMKKVILDHPINGKGFTDFYPWNVVYTNNPQFTIDDIYKFGIWHINGSINYPRSLKLSLSSYTRQGKRAIDFIHYTDIIDESNSKNKKWKGIRGCLITNVKTEL